MPPRSAHGSTNSLLSSSNSLQKTSKHFFTDIKSSLSRSNPRERVFMAMLFLVPFIIGGMFLSHVSSREQQLKGYLHRNSFSNIATVNINDNEQVEIDAGSTRQQEKRPKGIRWQQTEDELGDVLTQLNGSVTVEEIRKARLNRLRAIKGRSKPITPHVSLIAGCRDRSSFLLQAIGTWLNALDEDDELILVDWSTHGRLLSVASVAQLGGDDRVMTVSVRDQEDWILSRAYNLAAKFASGLNLLKVDCDTLLEPDFLDAHPLDESNGNSMFYKTSWQAARTENEIHLNGVFYVQRAKFLEAHGYDERITTYGWDDSDLYARLEAAGLKQKIMSFDKLHHIAHGDASRASNQKDVENPMIQTQSLVDLEVGRRKDLHTEPRISSSPVFALQAEIRAVKWLLPNAEEFIFDHQAVIMRVTAFSFHLINSLAIQQLGLWSDELRDKETKYTYRVLDTGFSRIEAAPFQEPRSLRDQLTPEETEKITKMAEERILHDAYGVPWDVINELVAPRKDVLNTMHKINSAASSRWGKGFGLVFTELLGTADERLIGLVNALALAKENNRPVIASWGRIGNRATGDLQPFSDFFEETLAEAGNSKKNPKPDVATLSNASTRIFAIRQWKCQNRLDVCVDWDKAYGRLADYYSGKDESYIFQVLEDKVPGKHHLLLRLNTSLSFLSRAAKFQALGSLMPSSELVSMVQSMGKVSGSLGVYLGVGMRLNQIHALSTKIERLINSNVYSQVFIVGHNDSQVRELRSTLAEYSVSKAEEMDKILATNESGPQRMRSKMAELYALGVFCTDIINDGKVPTPVLELVDLFHDLRK